jgi:hypothetical protein
MAKAESIPTTKESTAAQVAHELFELEDDFHVVRNLGYAALMLASADEMPAEPGAALHAIAELIVEKMDWLLAERERLCHLAQSEGASHGKS